MRAGGERDGPHRGRGRAGHRWGSWPWTAFADALLRKGAAKIYATARKPEPSENPRIVAEALDVTDTKCVQSLVERTGDVNIVFNNAGQLIQGPLLTSPLEAARATFDTNVFGALRIAQVYVPILARNGGGALVNIHSLLSWASGAGAYGASKAALWSLTNSLRLELAAQRTQVLGVHVGFVDTEMVASLNVPKISPDGVAETVLEALSAGQNEVLVDPITEKAKAALSGPVEDLALNRLTR
ncbi:SDR family oxidoreductase [Streptomyces solisilvae]|uniref:SDR family oxidoreductase n=1 Tax=Streptomyces malaysiensis TaxID=92644 RepID=UPI003690D024